MPLKEEPTAIYRYQIINRKCDKKCQNIEYQKVPLYGCHGSMWTLIQNVMSQEVETIIHSRYQMMDNLVEKCI